MFSIAYNVDIHAFPPSLCSIYPSIVTEDINLGLEIFFTAIIEANQVILLGHITPSNIQLLDLVLK